MAINLTKSEFLERAAEFPVVPLSVEVLADRETPVTAFEKLVGDEDGFLLESLEGGEHWARWSFAGWQPEFTLVSRDGKVSVDGAQIDLPPGDPLTVLEALLERYAIPKIDDAPPLHTGAVGYLAYDCVRFVEHLPNRPPDDRDLPEMVWQFAGFIAAFDRFRQTISLFRNVFVGADPAAQYDAAVADLNGAIAKLSASRRYEVRPRPDFVGRTRATANLTKDQFTTAVEKAIGYVNAGDAFQILPSVRFEAEFDGDAFAVYRALRLVNPSPFLFFVRHGSVSIAGASPELMSRVRDGQVFSRPIAGTRRRGATPEEDVALEEELLADPKERAEHVMLIDLARNDLGRVCEFGTVAVDDLMVVERYSHVMHIVSGVSGTLRSELGPIDVIRATFPHGTVSGAPKVRAMEIIDELEPTARGPYAGAVGYIDFSGNMDTAIALRTMVSSGTTAWIQAGAGIVADSDPDLEYEECINKLAAVLAALEGARDV
ncbi:MAG: anthranilate synthase component I [Acidimicrobiia bacterium]|nr:anthranilate synthase component I [Acidimicrobiia bacterium]